LLLLFVVVVRCYSFSKKKSTKAKIARAREGTTDVARSPDARECSLAKTEKKK
jgi:hypothetical protein